MDYLNRLHKILTLIEELMEDHEFISSIPGEDQSFLDTIWDYFDRVEAELNPDLTDVIDRQIDEVWQIQQDAETD